MDDPFGCLQGVKISSKMMQEILQKRNELHLCPLERFSNECRKTKTKVITPANHNRHKLSNEPIRTRSKYMLLVSSAGKNVRARASGD